MADEATEQASEQEASVEETTADSQSETQAQDSNAGSTEQAGENQGKAEGQADQSASTGDQQQSKNQDSKPDSKPRPRRSAAYRIQQLVNENNQLRQQAGKPPKEQDEWEAPQEDNPQPDIADLVAKEVERRLNPIVSESSKAADDAELSELFSGDKAAERSQYEGQIRELWKLPQYKDVAAADLHAMLVGKNMNTTVQAAVTKAIEDYKAAEKEAKESSASGSSNTSNRTGSSGKSVSDMTDEEFAAHNERVKAGQAK